MLMRFLPEFGLNDHGTTCLKSMEVGINFTEADRAFDLSLYSTFETKEDLSTYATHPEHLKVVELIKSVTTESKVVDYILVNK